MRIRTESPREEIDHVYVALRARMYNLQCCPRRRISWQTRRLLAAFLAASAEAQQKATKDGRDIGIPKIISHEFLRTHCHNPEVAELMQTALRVIFGGG